MHLAVSTSDMTFDEAVTWCMENDATMTTRFERDGVVTTLDMRGLTANERLRGPSWGAWKAQFVILVERMRAQLARGQSGVRPTELALKTVRRTG